MGDVIDPNKGVIKCYFKPYVLSVYFFKDATASVRMDNKSPITKNMKKAFSTSVWSAKHPNADQNIQHLELFFVTIKKWQLFAQIKEAVSD